jgi:UDP-2,3-diacylglucosamine hydrolase
MDHIFFSDVHLGAFSTQENNQLENDVINLVEYCSRNAIQLHIVGDLFDYWMEFPGYVPELGKALLNKFEEYNTQIQANYITGNHDHWTISHFTERGFKVYSDELVLTIGHNKTLLFHGDGLSDKRYELPHPVLNHVLRNRTFISFYRSLFSGKTGNHIMKKFSDFTRDSENLRPERLSTWSKSYLNKSDVDVIITGHDHIPRIETFNEGTYINCGAFYRDQTTARYTNNQFQLVLWNSKLQQFEPFDNIPVKLKSDE